jgi:hypothetical protein
MPLACEECDRVSDDAQGWIAMVVEENDELDTTSASPSTAPSAPGASSTTSPVAGRDDVFSDSRFQAR